LFGGWLHPEPAGIGDGYDTKEHHYKLLDHHSEAQKRMKLHY